MLKYVLCFFGIFFRHVLDTFLFSCSGGTLLSRICNGLKSVLVVKVLMCLFPVVDVITLPEALFDSVFCFVFCSAAPASEGAFTIHLPVKDCHIPEGTNCSMYGWGETKSTAVFH